jgi:hypothetical protein
MRHGRLALAHKPATIISNAIYGFLPISIRQCLQLDFACRLLAYDTKLPRWAARPYPHME